MKNLHHLRGLALVIASLASACGAEAPATQRDYPIRFHVVTASGDPVGAAGITLGARNVGSTDSQGTLVTSARGREGQSVEASVKCPTGYENSSPAQSLRLSAMRALGDTRGATDITVEMTCESNTRDVVVVVRAKGGGDLPIHVGAESAGTTDPDGNAYILLRVPRDETHIEVGLDTDLHRDIVPRSPSRSFSIARSDALVFYSEPLTRQKPKVKIVPRAKPPARPPIPIRLN